MMIMTSAVILTGLATLGNDPATSRIQQAEPATIGSCFERASNAAQLAYAGLFQADWHIEMTAIVSAKTVQQVRVRVGPYDGTLGGGVAARYDCRKQTLTTLGFER